jgi:hypothetical protein
MNNLFSMISASNFSSYDAKDYINGFDIGEYLFGHAGGSIKAFAKGDVYKMWALLPSESREQQTKRLKKNIEESEYREYNWISDYNDAESHILNIVCISVESQSVKSH